MRYCVWLKLFAIFFSFPSLHCIQYLQHSCLRKMYTFSPLRKSNSTFSAKEKLIGKNTCFLAKPQRQVNIVNELGKIVDHSWPSTGYNTTYHKQRWVVDGKMQLGIEPWMCREGFIFLPCNNQPTPRVANNIKRTARKY